MPKKWIPEDMFVVGRRPDIPDDAVKSAARVVQILEVFDELQRPATVIEICKRLAYPQSSTSAILRTLVSMGLLHHDPRKRTFVPTRRVALFGSWIDGDLFGRSKLRRMMDILNEQTGAIVLLATRNGRNAKYIEIVQSNCARVAERSVHLTLGTERNLTRCAAGEVILAGLSDAEIRRVVTATNAWSAPDEIRFTHTEVMERIKQVRKQGYALSLPPKGPRTGCIAMALPSSDPTQPLTLAIGGPREMIEGETRRLTSLMRSAMRVFDFDGGIESYCQARVAGL
ncbi:IclR family transcriptional regulator [Pararhodobacter marinus]|uniref:IclR family transcriptional regulator n=1 Tax=Pararhodobacter marinus TaxID=2184063 RepID=UPI003514FF96